MQEYLDIILYVYASVIGDFFFKKYFEKYTLQNILNSFRQPYICQVKVKTIMSVFNVEQVNDFRVDDHGVYH